MTRRPLLALLMIPAVYLVYAFVLLDLLWVVHVGPGERAFFVFIAVFAVLFAIPVILLIEETFE